MFLQFFPLLPKMNGSLDITLLSALVPSSQQQHIFSLVLAVIDPQTRTQINSQFIDSVAHMLAISKIPQSDARQAYVHRSAHVFILEGLIPIVEWNSATVKLQLPNFAL